GQPGHHHGVVDVADQPDPCILGEDRHVRGHLVVRCGPQHRLVGAGAQLHLEVRVDDAGAVGPHGELAVAEQDVDGPVGGDLTGEVPPAPHGDGPHVVDGLVVEVGGGAGGGVADLRQDPHPTGAAVAVEGLQPQVPAQVPQQAADGDVLDVLQAGSPVRPVPGGTAIARSQGGT